jgi:hypothetical protein
MKLDLYPPVTIPPFPATWEDIERLALHYPLVHQAVSYVRRGDMTKEQALIALVFGLADMFQKMFSAEVERRATEIPTHIVLPSALE